jgi:hypothetical protein
MSEYRQTIYLTQTTPKLDILFFSSYSPPFPSASCDADFLFDKQIIIGPFVVKERRGGHRERLVAVA